MVCRCRPAARVGSEQRKAGSAGREANQLGEVGTSRREQTHRHTDTQTTLLVQHQAALERVDENRHTDTQTTLLVQHQAALERVDENTVWAKVTPHINHSCPRTPVYSLLSPLVHL